MHRGRTKWPRGPHAAHGPLVCDPWLYPSGLYL